MRCCSLLLGLTIALAPIVGSTAADKHCSKDVLLPFFPKIFLDKALEKNNIPSDQWLSIANDLAAKDKQVIFMVEEKANKMNPNPLKDPAKRKEAVKLFDEVLQKVFTDVMHAHGVQDAQKIQNMFNEIKQDRTQRFTECFADDHLDEDGEQG